MVVLAQNWWTLALRGLAAVIFGILAYIWPDITFTVLVLLFGAYALWDGVFALIGAFRTQGERRWMLVLEGLVGIAAGLVTFFWPGAATLAVNRVESCRKPVRWATTCPNSPCAQRSAI